MMSCGIFSRLVVFRLWFANVRLSGFLFEGKPHLLALGSPRHAEFALETSSTEVWLKKLLDIELSVYHWYVLRVAELARFEWKP